MPEHRTTSRAYRNWFRLGTARFSLHFPQLCGNPAILPVFDIALPGIH